MYYLSLVAYYIFFNSSKVVYFLFLLLLASFYAFLLLDVMSNFQELPARVCKQEARNLVYYKIKFQETPTRLDSNGSYPILLWASHRCPTWSEADRWWSWPSKLWLMNCSDLISYFHCTYMLAHRISSVMSQNIRNEINAFIYFKYLCFLVELMFFFLLLE